MFTIENTSGYTESQIDQMNGELTARCKAAGYTDQRGAERADSDWYKHEAEQVEKLIA